MIHFTTILLFLLMFPVCAQELFWIKRFGGPGRDAISSSAVDSSGYNYHAGSFSQSLYFDDDPAVLTAAGNVDVFMTKFDRNGNLIWAKQLACSSDGYVQELLLLHDGTLLLFIRFRGVIDADMGTGEYLLTGTGTGFDVFLANYDSDGNFLWARQFEGTGDNSMNDMRVDGDGSIYVSGRFTGSLDFDPDPDNDDIRSSPGGLDSYLIKLSSVGAFQWGKHFTGPSGVLARDFFIYNRDIYFVGNFQGSMTIFPDNTPAKFSAGVNDLFITRMDIDGTLDTLVAYGSVRNDEFFGVAVSPDGIFLSGTFLTQIDIDPDPSGEHILTSNGGVDAFALALDSELRLLWVNYFGGSSFDFPGNIRTGPGGTLLYGLHYDGTISLDIAGETKALTSAGSTDAAILTLDATDGSVLSVYEIKGTGDENAVPYDFNDGDFLISGGFEGNTDFDYTAPGHTTIVSYGASDCYIMHIDLALISSTPGVPSPRSIHFYPVPISAGETLNIDIEELTGMVHLVDVAGRIVHTERLDSQQLHLPAHLSPNVYYILVIGDTGIRRAGSIIVK